MISNIPSIPTLPIVGNILALRQDRLKFFQYVHSTCGDLGIFHFGSKPVLMISDPVVIQTILVNNANACTKTKRLRSLLEKTIGNGIVTLEGQSHREQRRLLAPAFQPKTLGPYVTLIEKNTHTFLGQYKNVNVNCQDIFRTLAMNNIHHLIFGNTLDVFHQKKTQESWNIITSFLNDAMAQLFMLPLWMPIPKYTRFKNASTYLNETLMNIIVERRTNPIHTDIISLILRSTDNKLTNEQTRDHVLALFTAGHDPLAMTLTWMFVILASHEAIAQKVRHEIEQTTDPLSVDMLQHFPYTLQFIKEVLRLYPPAYVFTRRVVTPIEIPDVGLLPSGLTLGFSPYTIHRNERFFPDPEKFDPDRWTSDQEDLRPRYSYIPFGAGPHQCLGMHLAMLQLQTIVITIVRNWGIPKLINNGEIGMKPTTVLEPNRPIMATFHKK